MILTIRHSGGAAELLYALNVISRTGHRVILFHGGLNPDLEALIPAVSFIVASKRWDREPVDYAVPHRLRPHEIMLDAIDRFKVPGEALHEPWLFNVAIVFSSPEANRALAIASGREVLNSDWWKTGI